MEKKHERKRSENFCENHVKAQTVCSVHNNGKFTAFSGLLFKTVWPPHNIQKLTYILN